MTFKSPQKQQTVRVEVKPYTVLVLLTQTINDHGFVGCMEQSVDLTYQTVVSKLTKMVEVAQPYMQVTYRAYALL